MKLGVIMDPIAKINYKKDTTLAMLWEAEARGYELYYIEPQNIFFREGTVYANCQALKVFHDPMHWFQLQDFECLPLQTFNVVLMRKDPPFDLEYIYTTYLLQLVEEVGVLVVNKPQSLRDVNEKLFTMWFPQCCPPTLVTRDKALLKKFFQEQQDIVCKPPHGMGGSSVFRLTHPDENASVVFELLTNNGSSTVVAQRYIPDIREGDKRILMIHGEPIPYALARVPAAGELRGNLAAGATGVVKPLTEQDRKIAQQIGPILREKGLYFVGIDVIGNFLTEINVTSPTCLRELTEQTNLPIASMFFDCLRLS